MNILITGARSNIGYNIAKSLSIRGHIVYLGCKNLSEKQTLENKLKDESLIMFPLVLDLLNINNTLDNYNFDCIILNAAVANGGSVMELSLERLKEVIDVNIIGNFLLIQKYLRKCYYNKIKGKIFITSSLALFLPLPYLVSYTSSKLYLYNLARTLRFELMYQKIDVSISLILPGAYHTGFNDLMIYNKEKDELILKKKALEMSIYQKILFSLIERDNYDTLIREIVKNIESKKPKFIISKPLIQKIFVKFYIIFKSFIV